MSWRELAAETAGRLGDRLEGRRILLQAAGVPAAALLAGPDAVVPPAVVRQVRALVERRRAGEPLQWVLGEWGFRTLEVAVDGRALVPRPETEVVVERALAELDRAGPPWRVADLGTGSGVIALSIAAERPGAEVFATDRSARALALAAENLARLSEQVRRRVRLLEGDWFGALPQDLAGGFSLVVSNPPYLAAHEWPELEASVREYDPPQALVAGDTGLEAVCVLVAEAPGWLRSEGALVVEIAPHQREAALGLVQAAGGFASAEVFADLAGRPRVLVGRRAP